MIKGIRNLAYLIPILVFLVFIKSCKKEDNPPISANTVKDIDGNVYHFVIIGTQTWMVENLKVTHLNDKTPIKLVTDDFEWGNTSNPGYCWYNNDKAANKATYGALYNSFAINTGKLSPKGWHIPSDSEWKTLEMYLGMTKEQADDIGWRGYDQGAQLKKVTGWNPGEKGTNTSGFSALPGGDRGGAGGFYNLNLYGTWWCSSSGYRFMSYSGNQVGRDDSNISPGGFSVRCLKD